MEPNEEKFRAAALLTARNLAGALTSVTCKESLRTNMVQNLKTMCLQNGLSDQVISEKLLLLIASENMDLAINLVEKVSMERVSDQIDEVLATGVQNRKRYREVLLHFLLFIEVTYRRVGIAWSSVL
jgi:CCR4-NOT transcription complex subunit 1